MRFSIILKSIILFLQKIILMIRIAIHGGAGTIEPSMITPEKEQAYKSSLEIAMRIGYDVLSHNGTALDAVEAAVISLENNHLFNAGKGAVYNHDGRHDLDASLMCGATLKAGAVSGIQHILNPVSLCRKIIDHSDHVFLSGEGAEIFAEMQGMEKVPNHIFDDNFRYEQYQLSLKEDAVFLDHVSEKKFGTVGAVALDMYGNIAASTSTGGMTNKKYGRVGDTPMIGSGTYANNNTCAVSCTGHGEFFIRSVVAYDISCMMEYKGYSLKQACEEVVKKKLVNIGGEGGVIALDPNGNIELCFNSTGMYRGSMGDGLDTFVGIYK
jgi:L-asparaginase / beta-aspartyl-peptidase